MNDWDDRWDDDGQLFPYDANSIIIEDPFTTRDDPQICSCLACHPGSPLVHFWALMDFVGATSPNEVA